MKLDLILENVRNKYSLGLLEESEKISEKDLLKSKILINEATMNIRKILVENGLLNDTKIILENKMVTGLVGAGALYGGARAAGNYINKKIDEDKAEDIFGGHQVISRIVHPTDVDQLTGN